MDNAELQRAMASFQEWWDKNKPHNQEAQEAHVLMCWVAFEDGWKAAQDDRQLGPVGTNVP